jgi:hypothetical protein
MRSRVGPVLAISLLAAAAASGDEAVRRDGTRATGKLTLTDNGRFTFRTADRDEPVADLEFVRFVTKPPAARGPLFHQVILAHDERLLAEVDKLDDTHVHVHPAWGDRLAIPRTAIERVKQVPGWRLILFDTFDGDLSAWETTGAMRIEGGRLIFNAADQAVETKVKTPVVAGRVDIVFEASATKTRTLTLELGFARDGKPALVQIELIGPGEPYAVTSPAKPDHDGRLKRVAGPRRLTAEFAADHLHLFLDNLVLWTQSQGPGELKSIRLVAHGDGSEPASVHDIAVLRAERPTEPKPWADLTSDAVRSPDGDETFGALTGVRSTGVDLEVKRRKYALGWPDVKEFTLRRGPVGERATTGEQVRVRVRTTDGLRDVVEGAVKSFDDRALVLAHTVLGELTIPRDHLDEVRLLFHGRRVPVDSTPHHLGTRPAFGFSTPKPEGMYVTKSAKIESIPTAGFVIIDAAQVSPSGTPVEVSANGERAGVLNRLADRAEPAVRAYRLPVENWRRGENEIEVRLRPDDSGRRVTGVDVRAIRLELHDPR